MHTHYAGCGLGDYLQLVTPAEMPGKGLPGQSHAASVSNSELPESSKPEEPFQIPLCRSVTSMLLDEESMQLEAPGNRNVPAGVMSTGNAKRLAVSPVCGIRRIQQQQATALVLPEQQVEETASVQAHPLEGHSSTQNPARESARLLQQSFSPGNFMTDSSLGGASSQVSQSSSGEMSTIIGAPSQLRLPRPPRRQPMVHTDITPRYMFDPAVPLRVRSLLPEARITVILRGEINLTAQEPAFADAVSPTTRNDTRRIY